MDRNPDEKDGQPAKGKRGKTLPGCGGGRFLEVFRRHPGLKPGEAHALATFASELNFSDDAHGNPPRFREWRYMSFNRWAAEMCGGRRTLTELVPKLIAKGYLECRARLKGNGSADANEYRLTDKLFDDWEKGQMRELKSKKPEPKGGSAESAPPLVRNPHHPLVRNPHHPSAESALQAPSCAPSGVLPQGAPSKGSRSSPSSPKPKKPPSTKKPRPSESAAIMALAADWYCWATRVFPHLSDRPGMSILAFAEKLGMVQRRVRGQGGMPMTDEGLRMVFDFIQRSRFWTRAAYSPGGLLKVTDKAAGTRKIDTILAQLAGEKGAYLRIVAQSEPNWLDEAKP